MQPPVSQNINSTADYLCNWARQKSSVKAAVCVNRAVSVFLSLNIDSLIWKTGGVARLENVSHSPKHSGTERGGEKTEMKMEQNGLVQNWMFKCDNNNSKKQQKTNNSLDNNSAVSEIDVWPEKQKGFYQMHAFSNEQLITGRRRACTGSCNFLWNSETCINILISFSPRCCPQFKAYS